MIYSSLSSGFGLKYRQIRGGSGTNEWVIKKKEKGRTNGNDSGTVTQLEARVGA